MLPVPKARAVEAQIKARELEKKAEEEAQKKFYKRQLNLGELLLGRGLLNGVLQLFSGVLAALAVPMFVSFPTFLGQC
jgi:hypothetical protein